MSTQTQRLTTAQALVRFLSAQVTSRDEVERPLIGGIFGILGHGNAAGLGQAIAATPVHPRFFQGKNEQAMVHAAVGFAKANRLLSTLAVTTSIGPGATNLVTGAATASINRVPVLLLPGDVFASRRQGPVLQQLEDRRSFDVTVNDTLRPVSAYFDRITRPEQLMESLPHAVEALLRPGDTGAVTLALCQDTQGEAFDFPTGLFERRVHTAYRQPPADDAIRELVQRMTASKRPLIVSGGGTRYSEAEQALVQTANAFAIPVCETFGGRGTAKGAVWCAGGLGMNGSAAANTLAADADFVIALGTRLADTVTASHSIFQCPDVAFASINTSRHDAVKLYGLPVVGDARSALVELSKALSGAGWATEGDWRETVTGVIDDWTVRLSTELTQQSEVLQGYHVIDELALFTEELDRVVISSSTGLGHAYKLWDKRAAGQLDLEYGFSCMGHEIPAALGVRLATPDAGEVVAVIGDGTYLMGNTAELVTAIQEGLRITIVVLVNEGYQCIRQFEAGAIGSEFGTQFQMHDSSGNYEGSIVKIDYAANARSFGCEAFDVFTREEFRRALEASREGKVPCLIAVHVADDLFPVPAGAWWDIGIAEIGDGMEAVRATYASERTRQRWYV